MDMATIRQAIEGKDGEDTRFIGTLVLEAHITILEIVQGFLGDKVGVSGTIGEPVIVNENILLLSEGLEWTLVKTFEPMHLFRPPLNDEEVRKVVFAEYLMRFSEWGRPCMEVLPAGSPELEELPAGWARSIPEAVPIRKCMPHQYSQCEN